ncbi:uncharacterized protein LOC113005860 [Solenopsis invicta]|uniref:uncharacterized protein LOC113005860 n=1 Tax=Solenopsis invicta TaxID=13686 RepID=UPI00193D59E0|nr:uncharacterized protein LOC113005860 [Solenopsis invicta]
MSYARLYFFICIFVCNYIYKMDEDNNNVLTRRGSYKRYLQDDNVSVPESTIRSRIQREQMSLQQEQETDINDISVISEQLSVNSNENEHVTDAENSSDNSDQSINGPTASGSPKHNDDAVSVIIESNFDLLDKASDTIMDDISVVNKADSDTASISDSSNSSVGSERQNSFDVTSNNDTSDLEDVF